MKKRILVLFFVLLAMVLTLASCDIQVIVSLFGGETDEPEMIEVSFDSRGGSEVQSQLVELGGYVEEPEEPTREGFVFKGWYTDDSLSFKWRFDKDVVEKAITLYAGWGKAPAPAHKCESKCAECGKCTNNACNETACKNKCSGHIVEPAHECESECPECGKCLDKACGETACEEKCAGHTIEISGDIEVTLAEAGLETIYFEWLPLEGADGYVVYCDTIRVDNQLVRSYGTYFRCDVLGLTAAPHTIEIVPVKGDQELYESKAEFIATPMAHVREGFAFDGKGDANGAYNADGTLKADAVVIYVTNTTKNTVSLEMKTDKDKIETKVGIQNIILGLKKGYYEHPLCIRFIGNITDPAVLTGGDLKIDINNGAYSKGLTIEGVGNDATFNGFGLVMKGAKNVEVRNLGFMNCNSSEGDNVSLQQDNSYVWVHNCDLFYGDAGSDADQAKGDGALDVKTSTNITISFNHYYDSGKCNLQGMKDESVENKVTYHHNWYDHSDSRHPRVRTCTVHVYNNFYDGVSKYGIGATMGASIFAENNYFLNTSRPMSISMQGLDGGTFSSEDGGIIKAFGNVIIGQNGKQMITYSQNNTSFDYYDAKTRGEKVPSNVVSLQGGHGYSNFDTAADMYSYNVESAEDAMETVKAYAGRVQGGDFKWTFTDKDNTDYNVNSALKAALKAYKTSLVSVGGTSGESVEIPEGGNNGVDIPIIEGGIVHNFTTDGKESEFFQISGNLSSSKGTVNYEGLTLTRCLKMESSTVITFTLSQPGTMILVIGGEGSKNEWRVDVDDVDHQNITPEGATNYMLCILELEAGTHTIKKKDSTNLYYIVIDCSDNDGN